MVNNDELFAALNVKRITLRICFFSLLGAVSSQGVGAILKNSGSAGLTSQCKVLRCLYLIIHKNNAAKPVNGRLINWKKNHHQYQDDCRSAST